MANRKFLSTCEILNDSKRVMPITPQSALSLQVRRGRLQAPLENLPIKSFSLAPRGVTLVFGRIIGV